MIKERFLSKTGQHSITATLLVAVMLQFLLATACSKEKKDIVEVTFDPETTYTMKATGVVSLVSDSGITRYRVNAGEWLVFDKAKDPYWYFPKVFYVEKFDSVFNTEASVKSDTAYYFNKKELWHLIGNVEVQNLKGEYFDTSEMFWDQKAGKVYSEKNIRIIRFNGDTVIGRYGFESNQNMTKYKIFRSKADFTVSESSSADSTGFEGEPVELTPAPSILPSESLIRP